MDPNILAIKTCKLDYLGLVADLPVSQKKDSLLSTLRIKVHDQFKWV